MPIPDVTICIPAWQAEQFIDHTMRCARAQTHANVRILVSVDLSDDATEAICREHAAQDPRIDVVAQSERLGWSDNANDLLHRVDTEFYCLYFHDDIIEPTYIEALRGALLDHPEAKSAHCDMELFGNQQGLLPGNDYQGSDCRRLLNFMIGPVKGGPLRSLTRSELLSQGLCFPRIGNSGFWRCHPFLFQLLGAGPALRVPEVLYRHWVRKEGLTWNWAVNSLEPLIEGQRASARLCLQIFDRVKATNEERQLLRFALYLFIMTWTRRDEIRLGRERLVEPAAISPAFADTRAPASLAAQEPEVQAWFTNAQNELLALEQTFLSNARDRQSGNVP